MFENLKKRLQARIERNAVKIPSISWTDKKGRVHTEDIILKRSRFPLIGDWSRINPPIDENGKISWVNLIFGGKKNFIILLVIFGVLGMFYLSFADIFHQYESLSELCQPYLNILSP